MNLNEFAEFVEDRIQSIGDHAQSQVGLERVVRPLQGGIADELAARLTDDLGRLEVDRAHIGCLQLHRRLAHDGESRIRQFLAYCVNTFTGK